MHLVDTFIQSDLRQLGYTEELLKLDCCLVNFDFLTCPEEERKYRKLLGQEVPSEVFKNRKVTPPRSAGVP